MSPGDIKRWCGMPSVTQEAGGTGRNRLLWPRVWGPIRRLHLNPYRKPESRKICFKASCTHKMLKLHPATPQIQGNWACGQYWVGGAGEISYKEKVTFIGLLQESLHRLLLEMQNTEYCLQQAQAVLMKNKSPVPGTDYSRGKEQESEWKMRG